MSAASVDRDHVRKLVAGAITASIRAVNGVSRSTPWEDWPTYLSVDQVAFLLNVDPATVRKWAKKDGMPHMRVGLGKIHIPKTIFKPESCDEESENVKTWRAELHAPAR